MKSLRINQGFTLIELMIGLALSTTIVLAITAIFLSNSESYRINTAQGQIQESGRFAIELMSHDIRMTDTWGCAGNSLQPELPEPGQNIDLTKDALAVGFFRNTLRPTAGYSGQYQVPLEGHLDDDDNDLGQITAGFTLDETSDILTIRRGSSKTFDILPDSYDSDDDTNADVSFQSNAQADDLDWDQPIFLLNAQCNFAAVVNVNRANNGIISLADDEIIPGANYESGFIGQAISNTYFIADSAVEPGINALWLSRNGVTEELVTGIQSMRIHYGEGANQVDTYVRANDVGDWDDVRAIRIQLIAVGEPTNISDGDQSHRLFNYNAPNQDVVLPGNRIGQSFVTTVTLRNRVR